MDWSKKLQKRRYGEAPERGRELFLYTKLYNLYVQGRYGEAPGRGRELYSGLALTYVFLVDMEKPREGTRTFLTPKISKRVPNK